MRRIILFVMILHAIVIIGSCSFSKKNTRHYHISRFDSYFGVEDAFFVKHYELGERQYEFNIDTLSRTGNLFRIKGTIIDDVNQDTIPYPCLYLVSSEGSKYRIIKELCMGNISGDIDCCFEWNSQKSKPLIAIKTIGYCGNIYMIEIGDESLSNSKNE